MVGLRASAVAVVDGVRVLEAERKEKSPILVIDNYDSFTYNLCQYVGELGANLEVYRNDELTVEDVKKARYTSGFRNIFTDCFGTWAFNTFIWGLHGLAVHWRGFWSPFAAGRYHSLVIEKDSFPSMSLILQHGQKMDLLWLLDTKSTSIFRGCSSILRAL